MAQFSILRSIQEAGSLYSKNVKTCLLISCFFIGIMAFSHLIPRLVVRYFHIDVPVAKVLQEELALQVDQYGVVHQKSILEKVTAIKDRIVTHVQAFPVHHLGLLFLAFIVAYCLYIYFSIGIVNASIGMQAGKTVGLGSLFVSVQTFFRAIAGGALVALYLGFAVLLLGLASLALAFSIHAAGISDETTALLTITLFMVGLLYVMCIGLGYLLFSYVLLEDTQNTGIRKLLSVTQKITKGSRIKLWVFFFCMLVVMAAFSSILTLIFAKIHPLSFNQLYYLRLVLNTLTMPYFSLCFASIYKALQRA